MNPSGSTMPGMSGETPGGMPGMSGGMHEGMPGMSGGMPAAQTDPMSPMGQMPMGMMHEMSMMADLWKLPPQRLEAVFLSLMIPHHEGAITMAKFMPDRAAHQELKDLGQRIIQSQSDEITAMSAWLSSWYGLYSP